MEKYYKKDRKREIWKSRKKRTTNEVRGMSGQMERYLVD